MQLWHPLYHSLSLSCTSTHTTNNTWGLIIIHQHWRDTFYRHGDNAQQFPPPKAWMHSCSKDGHCASPPFYHHLSVSSALVATHTDYFTYLDNFSFEEFGQVDGQGEDKDGHCQLGHPAIDTLSAGDGPILVGMTHGQEAFESDGQHQENGITQHHVGEWV